MQRIQEISRIKKSNSTEASSYWFVLKELTGREIKRKYARSKLGIVWSVLDPLLHMVVMSLIFSYLFRRSIQNFPIYYLTGQIIWKLFSTSTSTSLSSLVDNKAFLTRTKLPLQLFVLSRVYTAFVNMGYSLIAYLLMLIVFKVKFTPFMLLFLPDILLVLLFSVGVSYLLSVLYVFFADIRYLYSVVLTLWMYLSAIFYPANALPEFMQTIIGYNPVFLAIYIARESVAYGRVPHISAWIKLVLYAVVVFVAGYVAYDQAENKIMQTI